MSGSHAQRRQVEDKIERLDTLVKRQPNNLCLIHERQYWARIAMWIHARIERQEHDERSVS